MHGQRANWRREGLGTGTKAGGSLQVAAEVPVQQCSFLVLFWAYCKGRMVPLVSSHVGDYRARSTHRLFCRSYRGRFDI